MAVLDAALVEAKSERRAGSAAEHVLTCFRALTRPLVKQDRPREFLSTDGVLECRCYMNSTIMVETVLESKDTASCRR
jgi:hypothetical protein